MKKSYISFVALMASLHNNPSQSSQAQAPQPQAPVIINFASYADANAHANPQHHAHMTQQNKMDVTQISEHKLIHVHTIDLHIAKSLEQLADSCKQQSSSILSWIDSAIEHKGKIILCILGACYGYLYYELHETNKILNEATSWCNWKQAVTLQHLTATKYDDLIQELLIDIQKKYLFSGNKSHILTYDHLVQELLHEKKALEQYKYILTWAQTFYLSKLLPLHTTQETIHEKISRLDVVINLFSTWQSKQSFTPII